MPTPQRLEKLQRMISHRQQGVVVLEDVFDPHNVAAVLRSCDAFGFHNIHLVFDKQKCYNPRRIGKSSSSSANKWLQYTVHPTMAECLQALKAEGYQIWATALNPRAVSLYEADFTTTPKVAIMFGNEHRGLSATAQEGADAQLYIPMQGMVQSLNISVTAGITLGEITRQRQAAGMDRFYLDASQRQALEALYIK